jgi:hypothetical protein
MDAAAHEGIRLAGFPFWMEYAEKKAIIRPV